ncbi:MAG: aspartate aminotransferase family protein [Proteobacteria bacterium]|nr:aspartate aminotransferase family protein [Pseudomonadota bacterium]MBI3497858.1 aspartate aminotransferase family protein [Pseudomonadota bacterium]
MPHYAKSVALHERARKVMAGGVSSGFRAQGKPVPLFFERGQGAVLTDVDGNTYIDYVLGLGPAILGHAPKRVLERVASTLAEGQVYAAQNLHELKLAERLTKLIPAAEMVRFASSGTEAVQAALRLARAYTGRAKIVKFEGHYHGWLDNIAISVKPALNAAGPASQPVPVPESAGQPESAFAEVIVLPWNDLAMVKKTMEERCGEIAGVIMEPILCNTSVVTPRAGYLEGVRALTQRHGSLLIFDEVITGFRVGLGGAQKRLGITPDLATFAKAVAAGFPLSCLVGRAEIMERLFTHGVLHGGTYNANVVSTSAALAALDELEADDGAVYAAMEKKGARLMEGLKQLARKHGLPLLVQGLGAVFNTAFTDQPAISDYRSAARADAALLTRFVDLLQEEGVRITTRGTWFLSTAHTDQQIEASIAATDKALAKLKP